MGAINCAIEAMAMAAYFLPSMRVAQGARNRARNAEKKYGFQTAVLGNFSKTVRSPLGMTLLKDPAWRLVYVDPLAVVFTRNASGAVNSRKLWHQMLCFSSVGTGFSRSFSFSPTRTMM